MTGLTQPRASETSIVPRKRGWPRSRRCVRRGWTLLVTVSILFTLVQFTDFVYYVALWREGDIIRVPRGTIEELGTERARLAAALTEILNEDGIPNAEQWASSIVRHSPSSDVSYIALVTAQIRRESNFQARDLEWLYDRVVPDIAHEMGVPDQVNTIGPMQIQRRTLQEIMSEPGDLAEAHDIKTASRSIDEGVFFASLYLDGLIREYIPDRNVRSWFHHRGQAELLTQGLPNQPMLWDNATFDERCATAAFQKMVADIADYPLVLDGVIGRQTAAAARYGVARLNPDERTDYLDAIDRALDPEPATPLRDSDAFAMVTRMWERTFGPGAPDTMFPRISHDDRLAFVLADFNCGFLSSRVAAIQFMLNDLAGADLNIDGKLGPITRASINVYLSGTSMPRERADEFAELLESGRKREWVVRTLNDLIGRDWRERFGATPPSALCPDFSFDNWTQQLKGIGRITTRDYVIASARFFEEYDVRLRRMLPKVDGDDAWSSEDHQTSG